MHKHIYVFLTILTACAITLRAAPRGKTLNANTIISIKDRQQALQDLEHLLKIKIIDFEDLDSPFFFDEKAETTVEPIITEEPEPEPVIKPQTANELIILSNVGRSLQPSGCIEKDGKLFLCIGGKQVISEKTILQVEYKGKTFEISIRNIQKKSFTLKLNNYSLTFNY